MQVVTLPCKNKLQMSLSCFILNLSVDILKFILTKVKQKSKY